MEKQIHPPKLVQIEGETGAYCDPLTGECFPANLQVSPRPLEKEAQPTGSAGEIGPAKKTE
jgi:hypothetical protein